MVFCFFYLRYESFVVIGMDGGIWWLRYIDFRY